MATAGWVSLQEAQKRVLTTPLAERNPEYFAGLFKALKELLPVRRFVNSNKRCIALDPTLREAPYNAAVFLFAGGVSDGTVSHLP
jgi:hypothetical protein